MNKRGLKHFFDLMFLVVVSFFMLIFIGMALNIGVNNSNDDSLDAWEIAKIGLSGPLPLLLQLNNQPQVAVGVFAGLDIDQAIANARVVEGYTVTTCYDLVKEEHCNQYKFAGKMCKWENNVCQNDE
jgi:hypothetical protein